VAIQLIFLEQGGVGESLQGGGSKKRRDMEFAWVMRFRGVPLGVGECQGMQIGAL